MGTNHFYRLQISKAQSFIRENLDQDITLSSIAEASGASRFHFIRIFSAYIGETPFEYIQRQKILKSLSLLLEATSLRDISFAVGFESQSSFNKAFKKHINLNPSEFRNLGKDQQKEIYYTLNTTTKQKEMLVNLNLSEKPEIIVREESVIYALEKRGGPFTEIAPLVWQNFVGILQEAKQDLSQSEYLGVSFMESNGPEEKHVYKAAVTGPKGKELHFTKLQKEIIPKTKYLKFVLKGPYVGVWPSFDKIFKYVNENSYELADGPCLENYLNDPNITPESELLTEILIPIK